jgi:LL-H family phage holin
MENINITPIIEALIGLLSIVITSFVIPWLKQKVAAEKLEKAKKWAKIAVEAAEQMYNESGKGEQKKEYVYNFLTTKGIVIDFDEVEALIESEVHKLAK